MKKSFCIFAGALLIWILCLQAGCRKHREYIDIIYTANMEGSFLELACNSPGGGRNLHTIPGIMEMVKKFREESIKEKTPYIIIEGGNSAFGIDGFNEFFQGEPFFVMLREYGYDMFFPGDGEYIYGIDHIKTDNSINILRGNRKKEDDSPEDSPEFITKIKNTRVEVFSFFEPKESPLMPGVGEIYPGADFNIHMDHLNRRIEKSTAGLKIVLCRVNDIQNFASRLKGADLIIPGRFHDCLKPGGPVEINGILVAPYINSRYHGVAKLRLYKRRGKPEMELLLGKPEGRPAMPPCLSRYEKEFRGVYGEDYEKVRNAFLGFGSDLLAHDIRKIQETPTSMAIADIIRHFTGADFAVINLLSVRKPLSGIIRGEYVEWVLPFTNNLVTMDLTGEQMEAIMKTNLHHSSSFFVYSGIAIEYHGDRDLKVFTMEGPLEKNRTYRVAVNDYLASGEKESYGIFRLGRNVHKYDIPINGILLSHITENLYIPIPPERIGEIDPGGISSIADQRERLLEAYRWGFWNIIGNSPENTHAGDFTKNDPYLIFPRSYLHLNLPGRALDSLRQLHGISRDRIYQERYLIMSGFGRSDALMEKNPFSRRSEILFRGMHAYNKGDVDGAEKIWKEGAEDFGDDLRFKRLWALFREKPANASPQWPCFKFDRGNTGRCPYKGPDKEPRVAWKFKTHHSIKSSPALGADGTIYFGGGDGIFYAVDPQGREKWRFQVGDYILSSPAVDRKGIVYFGGAPRRTKSRLKTFKDDSENQSDDSGYVYALYPDGSLKWRFETGGWVASSPVLDDTEGVVVGCNDHFLYCVNPDGSLKWKFKTGGKILSSPAIGHDGTIYAGSEDFHLYALTPHGDEKWRYRAENKFFSSPAVNPQGNIYIGNDDGKLYAFDPRGKTIWAEKFPAAITSTVSFADNGDIVAGCEDGGLYRLDADGKILWVFRGGDEFFSSPILDENGNIFIGCEDNFLYCVSPEGKMLWKFETGDYIESTPIISPEGRVYLSAEDHYFYCLQKK